MYKSLSNSVQVHAFLLPHPPYLLAIHTISTMSHTLSPPCLCFILCPVLFFTTISPHWNPHFSWFSSNITSSKNISLQKQFSEPHPPLHYHIIYSESLFSITDNTFISNSLLSLGRKKKRKREHLIKSCYTEEKSSEDSPITCGWITKNRLATRVMQFSGLSENSSYALGSIIFRGCFIKAISGNFMLKVTFKIINIIPSAEE